VLSLGPGVRIVLAVEPVDLRRGHDGLVSLVRERWRADPYGGTLFVFYGRRMDRVKILFFNAGGSSFITNASSVAASACPASLRGRRRLSWTPRR
jgi:transposase